MSRYGGYLSAFAQACAFHDAQLALREEEELLYRPRVYKKRWPYFYPRLIPGTVRGPRDRRARRKYLLRQSRECRPKRVDRDVARRRRTAVRRKSRNLAREIERIDGDVMNHEFSRIDSAVATHKRKFDDM